jgi:hypothetical protein
LLGGKLVFRYSLDELQAAPVLSLILHLEEGQAGKA